MWAKSISPTKLNVWTKTKFDYQDQLFMKQPRK